MVTVRHGMFDRRVLDQGTHWVKGQSEVVRVQDMCFAQLHNVLAMLTAQATHPHFQAIGKLRPPRLGPATVVSRRVRPDLLARC